MIYFAFPSAAYGTGLHRHLTDKNEPFRHRLGDHFIRSSITLTIKVQFGSYTEDSFKLKGPILRNRTTVFGVRALKQQAYLGCYSNNVAYI